MNINFTQSARTVTAYPVLNVSFEMAEGIHLFEAFLKKRPGLRITVTEVFKTIPNGSFSFRRKHLKVS